MSFEYWRKKGAVAGLQAPNCPPANPVLGFSFSGGPGATPALGCKRLPRLPLAFRRAHYWAHRVSAFHAAA